MISVASPPPVVQEPDPERAARAAAFRYESLLRRRAPSRLGGGSGECDEVIGRFCFRFGDDGTPDPAPEPEHPDVAAARASAIRAFRRWLSGAPARGEAAGGLIRYLIEDGRAGEAVPLARAHASFAGDLESLLFLGLAHHSAGDFVAAEAAFDSARALASPEERERLDDVGVLLEPGERRRYRRLAPEERAGYERRLWALSDPSLLTPGNERRSAHYARHAWARILEEAPRASGMLSWGDDHEQIVLRYGIPRNRERLEDWGWQIESELSMVEYYDPHAVVFVPPALLTAGVPREPEAGAPSYLERDTVRSSYAPVVLHRMRGLAIQSTRVPAASGWVFRVEASLPPDTAVPGVPAAPRGLLVLMDTLGREVTRSGAEVEVRPDSSTVVRARAELAPGSYVYQLEVADDTTGLAGLARYRVDILGGELRMSDPLIGPAAADGEVLGSPSRVLAPGQTVEVYAEVRGLQRVGGDARYAVEWWFEPRERGSVVGRALRWLGRSLGLVGQEEPAPRVRWEAASAEPDPAVIRFTLDLADTEPGLHRLGLTVRDRISGLETTSYRTVLLDPAARPLVGPGPD